MPCPRSLSTLLKCKCLLTSVILQYNHPGDWMKLYKTIAKRMIKHDSVNPSRQGEPLVVIAVFQFQIQSAFRISKKASHREKFAKNILSGGCAGSLSLLFVQSIDYTRTRLATDARR